MSMYIYTHTYIRIYIFVCIYIYLYLFMYAPPRAGSDLCWVLALPLDFVMGPVVRNTVNMDSHTCIHLSYNIDFSLSFCRLSHPIYLYVYISIYQFRYIHSVLVALPLDFVMETVVRDMHKILTGVSSYICTSVYISLSICLYLFTIFYMLLYIHKNMYIYIYIYI